PLNNFPDANVVFVENLAYAIKLAPVFTLTKYFTSYLIKILEHINATEVIAIGHSMGSSAVCWLDLYYPEFIKKRVFIDPYLHAHKTELDRVVLIDGEGFTREIQHKLIQDPAKEFE
ncbi:hypothetical protein ROZALSC1DRAFT_24095, partial [Rozella allomycis CSF55]